MASSLVELRKLTGAPISLCKEAAEKFPDSIDKAVEYIQSKLREKAGKLGTRETKVGIIEVYSHGTAKNIGVMVEVLCQTDFVAGNKEFRDFAHDLALQIASMRPLYVGVEDIPEEEIEKQKELWRDELSKSGKPAEIIDKIIEGKLQKWIEQVCLLEQEHYAKEGVKIKDILAQLSGKLGENIKISRFVRWEI